LLKFKSRAWYWRGTTILGFWRWLPRGQHAKGRLLAEAQKLYLSDNHLCHLVPSVTPEAKFQRIAGII
jgi:hypothetical protein